MFCVLATQEKIFPIFLIYKLGFWSFLFEISYAYLSTRNNFMIDLKQQSSSVFQVGMSRKSGVKCLSFVLFIGFFFLLLFSKHGGGELHHFMSSSEHDLEAGTQGLQCPEFESPAAISTMKYFLKKRTILMFMFVLISYILFCDFFALAVMGVFLWGDRKWEVWIFRNETLLLDCFLHNQQNWDFCFHLTAVIVSEFIFSIKFQSGLILFLFLIFLPVCIHTSTHTLTCTHMLAFSHPHTTTGKTEFVFPVPTSCPESYICSESLAC